MNEPITLTGDFASHQIVISSSITERRDAAIAVAKELEVTIKDANGLEEVRKVFVELKAIDKAVESVLKPMKQKVDAVGKEILEKKRTFLADVEKQIARLEGGINNYQLRQMEAQREVERKAAADASKAAKEAADAAKEAERLKQEAETMKAMPTATAEDIEAAELAALDAELASETVAPVATVALTEEVRGVKSRPMLDYKLKGSTPAQQAASLVAFVKDYPDLCKIEIKRSDTLKWLNAFDLPSDEMPAISGLEVFQTIRTSIR